MFPACNPISRDEERVYHWCCKLVIHTYWLYTTWSKRETKTLIVPENLPRMWMHHYDFPTMSKRAFLSHKRIRLFVQRTWPGYTQAHSRDQSRDRILLQGSLTRRYAEIEESTLYMQNAYSKMRTKVGEVESTHCLCVVVIYLSRLYKCRISPLPVYGFTCKNV